MVALKDIEASNAAFANQPLIAVFAGATSGIGESTLRALCTAHAENDHELKILLLGRNVISASRIIDDCKVICPKAVIHFIKAGDLSLLRDIDVACREVAEILGNEEGKPRVDLLVMSQGELSFTGRKDAPETLDASLSLLYYSRIRLTTNLLAYLLESTCPTGAHILSIYAAGLETSGSLHPTDLSLLSTTNYTFSNCRTHAIAMKTMSFETLTQDHEGKLSLTHIYPGLVIHDGVEKKGSPWWFKVVWRLLRPFARFVDVGIDEIGRRVLFFCGGRFCARGVVRKRVAMGTDGVVGGGAYSVKYTGETNVVRKFYEGLRKQGFQEAVWKHTQEVFESIEKEGRFAT